MSVAGVRVVEFGTNGCLVVCSRAISSFAKVAEWVANICNFLQVVAMKASHGLPSFTNAKVSELTFYSYTEQEAQLPKR